MRRSLARASFFLQIFLKNFYSHSLIFFKLDIYHYQSFSLFTFDL